MLCVHTYVLVCGVCVYVCACVWCVYVCACVWCVYVLVCAAVCLFFNINSSFYSFSQTLPGDGEKSFTHPLSVADKLLDLDLETNGRRIGAFVYRVDQTEIVEPSPGEGE